MNYNTKISERIGNSPDSGELDIQKELMKFAFEKAYPYIIKQPIISEHLHNISFLLVGSTATGLCTVNSDVDICLLCPQNIFDILSVNTQWINGRPSEVIIDNKQLHYYAISIQAVIEKIKKIDDIALYVYGTAVIINDEAKLFSNIRHLILNPELLERRKQGALDILSRRKRALDSILAKEKDPVARMRICMELTEHLLKVIALSDNLQFDIRKRFYLTALKGENGRVLKSKIDILLSLISDLRNSENTIASKEFLNTFDYCFDFIKSPENYFDL